MERITVILQLQLLALNPHSYGISYFQLINVTATTAKLAKSTTDYPTSLGDNQELVK